MDRTQDVRFEREACASRPTEVPIPTFIKYFHIRIDVQNEQIRTRKHSFTRSSIVAVDPDQSRLELQDGPSTVSIVWLPLKRFPNVHQCNTIQQPCLIATLNRISVGDKDIRAHLHFEKTCRGHECCLPTRCFATRRDRVHPNSRAP